jgi:hypothetical protein
MSLSINLSKTAWHYRLQRFVWGENQPQLWSLCPYFWFTIFTVLVLPLDLLLRGLIGLVKTVLVPLINFVAEALDAFWTIHVTVPMNRTLRLETLAWIKATPILDVLVQIGYFQDFGDYDYKAVNTQPTFFGQTLGKYEVRELLVMVYGDEYVRSLISNTLWGNFHDMEAKEAAMERNAYKPWKPTWWVPFVKYTEIILKGTFITVGVLSAIALIVLLCVVFSRMDNHDWAMFGVVVCGFLVGIGLVIGFVASRLPHYLGLGFNQAGKSTSLLLNFARNAFKKACPSIDWEE